MHYRNRIGWGLLLLANVAWAQPDTTITVRAVGGLQYEPKRIVVKPNTRVRLILKNDDDMAHNLVLTRPNSRLRVVEFALALDANGPALHYVPRTDDVLAHTRTAEPGTADTLTVRVPEGTFPYVCTYPGHGSIMYGALYATNEPDRLPPAGQDPNLPNANVVAGHTPEHHALPNATASGHPYPFTLPAVYRTFMPDCGPAAIAVGLPARSGAPQQSYCFDAGTCRLRYAWSGGFVDMREQWDGKGQRLTKVVGDIYYRDNAFPWQMSANQTVRFLGYRLVDRYPEFRYSIDGLEIRETIRPITNRYGPARRGLVRQFTLTPTKRPLTFVAGSPAGVRVRTSAGVLRNGSVRLRPGTRNFFVFIETI